MSLPHDGPARLLETLQFVARNRLILVKEIRAQYNPALFAHELDSNLPVPDNYIEEMRVRAKDKNTPFGEHFRAVLATITPLPENWMELRKQHTAKDDIQPPKTPAQLDAEAAEDAKSPRWYYRRQ